MLAAGIAVGSWTKLAFLLASLATMVLVRRGPHGSNPWARECMIAVFVVFATAIAIAGCGEQYHEGDERHRSDVVPIVGFTAEPHHSPATIEGAEELLGLELSSDVYDNGEGAVFLTLSPRMGGHLGETEVVDRCSPVVWAVDEPVALAHEIGHALGLQHTDDPSNLMYPSERGGVELTDEQIDFMRWDAWYLQHRC